MVPLSVKKAWRPMEIKRPNHERFEMNLEEHMAFWFIIIREYQWRYVRENSLRLYKNTSMVRTDEDA